jgi:hypothetical protein
MQKATLKMIKMRQDAALTPPGHRGDAAGTPR